jgi:proteasome lid subunit RPN8/RPN11
VATTPRPKRISISPEIIAGLEKHSYSNLEAEVGGMLFGQIEGGQTKISGFIPALTASAEQISLTFTHEVWEEILREGSKNFPNDQIVGWYHTHPAFGLFLSEYDLFIQTNFFSMKGQVALVIDPIAGKMGWFESAMDQAKMIFEEPTKTGPKSLRSEAKSKTLRKAPTALIGMASGVIGLCVGSAVALANMPPNLSGQLLSLQDEVSFYEQQSQFMSDLLGRLGQAPTLQYTVSNGDTVASILTKFYGQTADRKALESANPGVNLDQLVAGSKLRIPNPTGITVELEEPEPTPSVTPEPTPSVTPEPTPSVTPEPTPSK